MKEQVLARLRRGGAKAPCALMLCLSLFALLVACDDGVGGDRVAEAPPLPPRDEPDAGSSAAPPCIPAVASEHLPARSATIGNDKTGSDEGMHVSALFQEFKTYCGECHAKPANHGQFSMALDDFLNSTDETTVAKINKTILLIRSDDPRKVMPKDGPLLKDRPVDHPLRAFADHLEQWLAAGRPPIFFPDDDETKTRTDGVPGGTGTFHMRSEVGLSLSNMGNCVPMGRPAMAKRALAQELDEKFAAMTEFADLPKKLSQTDLTTLDSAQLMEQGIFNYAPAYTLWADNAKKIRMVRVPVGTSIEFDKDAQTFEIPENTRFYKTFLKKVVPLDAKNPEHEGRYRKVETRIIIARRAEPGPDGAPIQKAIFGTYLWNEDESEATLLDKPYRDEHGFQDKIVQVVVDEQIDDKLQRGQIKLDQDYKDPTAARIAAGSVRNYAVPGFDRCVQCHMGAPLQDFILGFTPLQIWRRPLGEGGVVEPASRDELNQLERFINYGLITGISSPGEIVPLEKSQGTREPRNQHELNAQGYMLGNCAHCHNPNGFPSLKESVMKEDLNFWPSAEGGIFQYPLERYSRRTFRGAAQDVRIPYITPSLYDHTPQRLGAEDEILNGRGAKWIMSPKYAPSGFYQWPTHLTQPLQSARPLHAPWRSLIYRNVDAPFSYEESGTVFPHMPMHTPGYDCRARQLLGSWMTSIPAWWIKEGTILSYTGGQEGTVDVPLAQGGVEDEGFLLGLDHDFDQPYKEVTASDPGYFRASLLADTRLKQFQESPRYRDCPKPTDDILDPKVAAAGTGTPEHGQTFLTGPDGKVTEDFYELYAPKRPHYFATDTRIGGTWSLRRGDWYKSLVEGKDAYITDTQGREDFARLRAILEQIKLDDGWRTFATTKVPFGLWDEANQAKAGCEAELERRGIPKVSSFESMARPEWMRNVPATQVGSSSYLPSARVYMTSPGEHVFEMVCSKCHGSKGDGNSALASTMLDMTGGLTRVANLQDGFFGPMSSPGTNRAAPLRAFGVITDPIERENWAVRYLVWMGLGGTRATIPPAVVGTLRRFIVLGELSSMKATFDSFSATDAGNMLKIAKEFCSLVSTGEGFDVNRGRPSVELGVLDKELAKAGLIGTAPGNEKVFGVESQGFIAKNGHAEMWQRLCSFRNPMPVRRISYVGRDAATGKELFSQFGRYRRANYPVNTAVGDGGAVAASLRDDNVDPWCVVDPLQLGASADLQRKSRELTELQQRSGKALPMCPATVANLDDPGQLDGSEQELVDWEIRAAANAGVTVFLFMDDLNKRVSAGELSPRNVAWDRCQDFVSN